MSARFCISLFVLQFAVVLVFSAETDDCIAFKYEVQHTDPEHLIMECRIEQCQESPYLKATRIKISTVFNGADAVLASIERSSDTAAGTSVLGKGPKVSGDLNLDDNNQYLSISWNNPDSDLEMQYSCAIDVLNDYGAKRTLSAKAVVSLKENPGTAEPTEPTDPTVDCKTQTESLSEKVQELELKLAERDTHCNETGGPSDSIVRLFFKENPLSYDNKMYYISAKPYLEDEQSDDLCNIVGGYLVEVNDAEEYKAVIKYIKSNYADGALISGTDNAKEGSWVYHRSKRPVTYFNWMKGQPDNNKGRENCIIVWIEAGDVMNDVVCKGNPYRYPFICEVDV
ncbi:hypothetical protein Btru_005063 [Bulinus truncatus]|nr:hypothetical protein Btru_005063 [Bulinus truncatus]